MKSATVAKLLTLSLILACAGFGCKKSPKGVTYIPPAARSGPGVGTPSGIAGPGAGLPLGSNNDISRLPTNPDGTTPLGDREERGNFIVDRETFKEQTVYFDFDRSEVKPGERPKVEAVAAFMKNEMTFKLEVEGHCDERGTTEYNRALGERRALAIRELLIGMGVGPERVTTISFGEDDPEVLGNDEFAWSKNRRGEFVLLKPKF